MKIEWNIDHIRKDEDKGVQNSSNVIGMSPIFSLSPTSLFSYISDVNHHIKIKDNQDWEPSEPSREPS